MTHGQLKANNGAQNVSDVAVRGVFYCLEFEATGSFHANRTTTRTSIMIIVAPYPGMLAPLNSIVDILLADYVNQHLSLERAIGLMTFTSCIVRVRPDPARSRPCNRLTRPIHPSVHFRPNR